MCDEFIGGDTKGDASRCRMRAIVAGESNKFIFGQLCNGFFNNIILPGIFLFFLVEVY